jgi:hypothetical protein
MSTSDFQMRKKAQHLPQGSWMRRRPDKRPEGMTVLQHTASAASVLSRTSGPVHDLTTDMLLKPHAWHQVSAGSTNTSKRVLAGAGPTRKGRPGQWCPGGVLLPHAPIMHVHTCSSHTGDYIHPGGQHTSNEQLCFAVMGDQPIPGIATVLKGLGPPLWPLLDSSLLYRRVAEYQQA